MPSAPMKLFLTALLVVYIPVPAELSILIPMLLGAVPPEDALIDSCTVDWPIVLLLVNVGAMRNVRYSDPDVSAKVAFSLNSQYERLILVPAVYVDVTSQDDTEDGPPLFSLKVNFPVLVVSPKPAPAGRLPSDIDAVEEVRKRITAPLTFSSSY